MSDGHTTKRRRENRREKRRREKWRRKKRRRKKQKMMTKMTGVIMKKESTLTREWSSRGESKGMSQMN